MKPLANRAIVIGASSGMGAALGKRLVKMGYQVAMVARREPELREVCEKIGSEGGKAIPYIFDASHFSEVPKLFDRMVTELGGLDLVIYAAGVMPRIEKDEYDFEKDRQMVEVNLLGAIAWLNEAAMFFSRIKRGTIVGISSMAGERGRRGNPVYGATKAGFNCYLESLRNRLDQHSVHVLTIKPGFVDTAMTRGMKGLFWLITADEAARRILAAVEKRWQTVFVPCRWHFVSLVIRLMPSFIFRKLDI